MSCPRAHALVIVLLLPPNVTAQRLTAGPMVGHATESEATLWLQTSGVADVVVRFWPESGAGAGEAGPSRISAALRAVPERDHCVHVPLRDLPAGTRFAYEVYVNGRLAKRPYRLGFQTQPHWRWRTEPPDFTVAIGSCAYVNDPPFDRPGAPYGGDPGIFATIAKERPDLMLWLGDNVYFREPDWTSVSGLRRRYRTHRAHPALQPLLGASHHYAIWDDHDYGPNDSDRTYALKRRSLETFKLYWANPGYGLPETPGIFTRFTWGDVEFFLLDDRYHRSPNRSLPRERRVMFGERQLTWLIDALASSLATFKVVAAGNQILNPLTYYEGFGNCPKEREKLLDALARQATPGVFFLSGDRHHAELIKIEREGQYPLYDFTSSPLTSGLHRPGREAENTARVPGTLVTAHRNYGLLGFTGPRHDRRVTMVCKDASGATLWSHTLRDRELTNP